MAGVAGAAANRRLRSARNSRTIPALSRMCPKPAMPAIMLDDSWPSTVRQPCHTIIADVSTRPALYSQKNQLKRRLGERERLLQEQDDQQHDEAQREQVRVHEAELRRLPLGKPFILVNSR